MNDRGHNIHLFRLGALLLSGILFFAPLSVRSQDAEFWYEHKLKSMSLDEKIGQLFMVAAYSNRDAAHTADIETLVADYHIGGLIFFQDDPLKQAYLTNYYQSISSTPLMIGIDGEWGLPMRLRNTQKFPYAITMGALQEDSLVYQMGIAMAKQFRRLGIHINFAPDVDINTDPSNPIIGFRSFGDDKHRVAALGAAYSLGLMSEGVLSCAKHFPGHGDVHTDSHLDLPVVDKSLAQIDSLELYPFRHLIAAGVASIMVAHIHYPQLDNRPNRPASLSKFIVDTLLRQRMHFEGLIFTDALNMKGVAKYYQPGYADLEALMAGNDILLFSENVPVAISLIRQAIAEGRITEQELNEHVLRILKWKQTAGLDQYKPIDINNLEKDLEGKENEDLLQEVADKAVVAVRNGQLSLPVSKSSTVVVAIGDEANSSWQQALHKEGFKTIIIAPKDGDAKKRAALLRKIIPYHHVIISLNKPKVWNQQTAGYTDNDYALIRQIAAKKPSIIVGFCSPYALRSVPSNAGLIAAFEDTRYFHQAAAQVLSGKLRASGKMPVKLAKTEPGHAFHAGKNGMDNEVLSNIDPIVAQLLAKKGSPGCRILVLKDGKPVFNKSYGYLNYDKQQKVNDSTIYDIASITKIASTTLAVMKLYEEGKIDLKQTLGHYLERARGTNKENLVISDILQHRAGLTAWIPFYKETLPYLDSIYCPKEDSMFCVKVADKFYMLRANRDTVYKRVFDSELESRVYRYSDLSMMLMQLVVEKVSGEPLDEYVSRNFYEPMGLKHIGYNIWKTHALTNIAPTQEDRLFRQQELCGYVHDPAAAMLGGVSGHAGVFSTAADLAALMQMLNDKGTYRGHQYLKPATIELFTARQRSDSRRGLGFDKPELKGKNPASDLCSPLTFGHTGFTGTCAWVDPKYNLVFIFLSNRICPEEENKELISGNYRTRIQDVVYQALGL